MPGWAIDLIRDGVSASGLGRAGDQAVWSALVRTATSAHQRGWSDIEWEAEVCDVRSRLGQQVRIARGTPRKPADVRRALADAWDAAVVWVSLQPRPHRSRDQAQADARQTVRDVRTWLAGPDVPMHNLDRAVLAHACDAADRHGSSTPALPLRAAAAATGTSQRQTRRALDHLIRNGLLVCTDRGRPGKASGRAACYRLPDDRARTAYLYRETRSVLRPADSVQVCAPPAVGAHAPPAQVCAPPRPDEETTAMSVVTLSISAPDAEALAAALAALRGQKEVHVAVADPEGPTADVVPLRRAGA